MKYIAKKILSLVMLILLALSLSSCTAPIGIEEFAYVIAIGLDTATDDTILLTLQFATSGGENSSGSSSMQSTQTNISSVKCSTIDSGIALINSHVSKKINLSHCKEIIISEELAKKGIEIYLDTLINNPNLTTDAEMLISKCSAKEYIENVNPVFEVLLPQYYTDINNISDYAAFSSNMNLATFYTLLKDSYFQPYANLGNISKNSKSANIQDSINANFTAGDYEIDDKNPIQNIGFVAFNKDKLVGEFTGLDSLCFLSIINELEESTLTIPSPFEENSYMDLCITSCKKSKCSVDLNGTTPTIHVNVFFTGFGQSMDDNTSYSDEESTKKIKKAAEDYMRENMENFLYKTSSEFNSDICGFGRFAVKHYLTMEDWQNANWLDNYKNCKFDVNVSFNIKAGNIFSET